MAPFRACGDSEAIQCAGGSTKLPHLMLLLFVLSLLVPATCQPASLQSLLIVSLLDGRLAGVDANSGKLMWMFDTGHPLLSSSDDAITSPKRAGIVPGLDGALYTLSDDGSATAQRLPVNVNQLATASPAATADGTILHGSSASLTFVLDPASGELLKKLEPYKANPIYQTHSEATDVQPPPTPKAETASDARMRDISASSSIFIGRQDFSVHAVDSETGENIWNASYGILFPNGGSASPSFDSKGTRKLSTMRKRGFVNQLQFEGSSISVDQNGSVAKLDPGGRVEWTLSFSSFPVQLADVFGEAVATHKPPEEGQQSSDILRNAASSGQRIRVVSSSGGYCALPEPNTLTMSELHKLPAGSSNAMPALMPTSTNLAGEVWNHGLPLGKRDLLYKAALILMCMLAILSLSLILRKHVIGKRDDDLKNVSAKVKGENLHGSTTQDQESQHDTCKDFAGTERTLHTNPVNKSRNDTDDTVHMNVVDSLNGDCIADESYESRQRSHEATSTSKISPDLRADGWAKIGNLIIGPKTIGRGSSGTVVFEGYFYKRKVAVKRLVSEYHELAENEINALLQSDSHPNVVRHFAVERTTNFIYLALERCEWTLAELVNQACSNTHEDQSVACTTIQLFDAENKPSAEALGLLYDVASGLNFVHEQGITHRDLKPSNVLITESGQAKLADMGLSRYLVGDESFASNNSGGGTSGWQAPERLRNGRQTKAVDLFALGLIIFYTATGGLHPFGEAALRDANTLNGNPDLDALSHLPEARHLLRNLLSTEPQHRPSAEGVLKHLLWWSPERRLAFLVDISERMELEDRESDGRLLRVFESGSYTALNGMWTDMLSEGLIDNIGRYRKYNAHSIRDLLRVIRNKRHHYSELPLELQEELGSVPDGFLRYFTCRFPRVLLYAYCFAQKHFAHETVFRKYFSSPHVYAPGHSVSLETLEAALDFDSTAPRTPIEDTFSKVWHHANSNSTESNTHVFPRRPGRKECDFYMKTGRCKFGARCHFDHPERR